MARFGALQVGLIWQRLSGFIDEAAEVFVRTSFSSVVRDNWDMAVGLSSTTPSARSGRRDAAIRLR